MEEDKEEREELGRWQAKRRTCGPGDVHRLDLPAWIDVQSCGACDQRTHSGGWRVTIVFLLGSSLTSLIVVSHHIFA